MRAEFTAVIKQAEGWWIGWIEELPGVNCQEKTRDELMESLRETLREALEFNKHEALTAAGSGFNEVKISL
jgi:predicted RNase H-like HicB family nuclease